MGRSRNFDGCSGLPVLIVLYLINERMYRHLPALFWFY